MKALVDAHTLIWAVDRPEELGDRAEEVLKDRSNELLLSTGNIWEIGIKVGIGKLSLSIPYENWMNQAISELGLKILPITIESAAIQAKLPNYHGDPFDSLMVAQAQAEKASIISKDDTLDEYKIDRIW